MILQALITILACWINQHREQPSQGLGFNLLLHPRYGLGTLSDNTLVYWTREKGVITGNAAEYIWCRRASLLASRRGVESHRQRDPPLENVLNSRLCHDVMAPEKDVRMTSLAHGKGGS